MLLVSTSVRNGCSSTEISPLGTTSNFQNHSSPDVENRKLHRLYFQMFLTRILFFFFYKKNELIESYMQDLKWAPHKIRGSWSVLTLSVWIAQLVCRRRAYHASQCCLQPTSCCNSLPCIQMHRCQSLLVVNLKITTVTIWTEHDNTQKFEGKYEFKH